MPQIRINGLIATYDKSLSWEHRRWYELENGCLISVAWSQHYGPFVSSVADNQGFWKASDGIKTLPNRFKWILEWEKPIGPDHWDKLLYPNITYHDE